MNWTIPVPGDGRGVMTADFDEDEDLDVYAGGNYKIYRYDHLGGTNWADAVEHSLLQAAVHGSPEVLCLDPDGKLYVGCYHPAVKPSGMGIYRVDSEMATPVLYAGMDDVSGHTPKDMSYGPDDKVWMWINTWGLLSWPVGGVTTGFTLRVSDATHGGLGFDENGLLYGCVDNTYEEFGYYDVSGVKAGELFADPFLDQAKSFYNMDFGPDKNGDGVCDIYIVF